MKQLCVPYYQVVNDYNEQVMEVERRFEKEEWAKEYIKYLETVAEQRAGIRLSSCINVQLSEDENNIADLMVLNMGNPNAFWAIGYTSDYTE